MANTPYQTTNSAGVGGFQFLNFNYDLAKISAADIMVDFAVPFPFKLVDIRACVTDPATTGSKAATITAKIDGTAVTGASIALTSANMTPIGTIQTGTAKDVLSGGNNVAYAAGSKIKITGSSVTAFVEGSVTISICLQSLA